MKDTNLLKRTIVGIIGIPLILLLVYLGGHYLFAMVLILSSLCLYELGQLFRKREIEIPTIFLILISITLQTLKYFNIESFELYIMIVFPVLIFFELLRKKRSLLNIIVSLSSLIYITVPFILLLELSVDYRIGILIFLFVWSSDIFSYFGGILLGQHKLITISPNKTVEGLISGIVFTVVVSIVYGFYVIGTRSLWYWALTGLIATLSATTGDIFESMLKRFCLVKDSSNIIPGHGGILDRFDSLLIVVPIIFFFFKLI
ncbi:MAG: phosphatidate cytidylyltransferase [Ignavibacteria bacterium]